MGGTDAAAARKKAASLQEAFTGVPHFPDEAEPRSYSVADERSAFKRWAPANGYGATVSAVLREGHLLVDGEDHLCALPMRTQGHSLVRSGSGYSRSGASFHSRSTLTSVVPEASFSACVMTLTKTILGSGLLGLPFVCYLNGLGLYALALVLFAGLSAYSMQLLVLATDLAHPFGEAPLDMDFGTLGSLAFGTAGLRAVQLVVGVDLWGTLVAYMVVIADVVQPPLLVWLAGTGLEWLAHRYLVMGVSGALALPFCTGKGIGALQSSATLGLLAIAAFVVFILLRCVSTDFGAHLAAAPTFTAGLGFVRSLPVVAFLYNAHFNVFSIHNSLERRTSVRMGLVITTACAISTVVAFGVGAAGCVLYGAAVRENVLQNMPLRDTPAGLVRLLFGVAILFTYPVVAFELRQMMEAVFAGRPGKRVRRLALAAVVVASSSLAAIAVPNITVAFGLVGGTTTTAMAFILPPAFFLKIYHTREGAHRCWRVLPVYIVFALGLAGAPFLTYLTVQEALA
eukprot:EG_transcript_7468